MRPRVFQIGLVAALLAGLALRLAVIASPLASLVMVEFGYQMLLGIAFVLYMTVAASQTCMMEGTTCQCTPNHA